MDLALLYIGLLCFYPQSSAQFDVACVFLNPLYLSLLKSSSQPVSLAVPVFSTVQVLKCCQLFRRDGHFFQRLRLVIPVYMLRVEYVVYERQQSVQLAISSSARRVSRHIKTNRSKQPGSIPLFFFGSSCRLRGFPEMTATAARRVVQTLPAINRSVQQRTL